MDIQEIFKIHIFPILSPGILGVLQNVQKTVLEQVTEIRLRVNQPLLLVLSTRDVICGCPQYYCTQDDLARTMQLISKNSVYALEEELKLGYRMSSILMYGYTILEVAFNLEKGEYQKIENRIDDLNRRRSEKQPLEYASAGSTFKRPAGHFAAKLIEDSGLKGESVGDAQVSEKHSGFIINRGNATASDILNLIKVVQDRVKEKFNVDLYTEVRIIGED